MSDFYGDGARHFQAVFDTGGWQTVHERSSCITRSRAMIAR